MSHRPVCVKCEVEMISKRNSVGCLDIVNWGNYQVWSADSYICPTCAYEIIIGFGCKPTRHHESNFKQEIEFYDKAGILFKNRCC